MKSCSNKKCKQNNPQPLENFNKHRHGKDGLQWWCKSCFYELSKNRAFDQDPTLEEKRCKRCDTIKSVEYFWRDSKIKDGYANTCIECGKKSRERHYKPDDTLREYTCFSCKETKSIKSFSKNKRNITGYSYECKDCKASRSLVYSYNITEEEYQSKLIQQNNACAICNRSQDDFERRLSVDHDHSCCDGDFSCGNCIRGLLCGICNRVLAWYEKHDKEIENYLSGVSKNV